MNRSVIAIGLDAANPELLQRWMKRGLLPHISRMRDKGAFGTLSSCIKHNRSETVWSMFLTGCLANKLGYWTPVRYDSNSYSCEAPGYDGGAYAFDKYKPFYANLGPEFPVAIFDQPQTCLLDEREIHGVQVLGWGSHARMTPIASTPSQLLKELVQRHGENPLLDRDSFAACSAEDEARYYKGLYEGISRKTDITLDLMQRKRWSLLLTIFAEGHSAQHNLWHRSQPHTLNRGVEAPPADDPMLKAFQAIDDAIGRILEAASPDTTVILFAVHGTKSNSADLGNTFLAEMMFRWNFAGQYGLGPGKPDGLPLPAPRTATETAWHSEVWDTRYEPKRAKYFARTRIPKRHYWKLRLERLTGRATPPSLPLDHKTALRWLPPTWYQKHWPQMKAFALPSYSDGYIRVNLKGRESHGVVEPADYNRVLDEITDMLWAIRDGRKCERLIKEIIRTRTGPEQDGPEYPEADLAILFEEQDCPADVVDHPIHGRVGPLPFYRTGGHYSTGFLCASGPSIQAGGSVVGDVLDITPTLLSLMGAPIPEYMDGKPLHIDLRQSTSATSDAAE